MDTKYNLVREPTLMEIKKLELITCSTTTVHKTYQKVLEYPKLNFEVCYNPLADCKSPTDTLVKTLILRAHSLASVCLILPETGLHPFEQFKFVEYCVSKFVNLRIFTTSEHCFNAIRYCVTESILNFKDVQTHFYNNDGLTEMSMQRGATYNAWPEGFFDQTEKELMLLFDSRINP